MNIERSKVQIGSTKYITKYDEICFNLKNFNNTQFNENEMVELIIDDKVLRATVTFTYKESNTLLYVTKQFQKFIEDNSNITINKLEKVDIKVAGMLPAKYLKRNIVMVSRNIYDKIFTSNDIQYMVIVNNLNGYLLKIHKKGVLIDENNNTTAINISRKYRNLLELELPTYINDSYIKKLESCGDIKSLYCDEKHNIEVDNIYNQSIKFKNIMKKSTINMISIYQGYEKKKSFKFLRELDEFILSKLIGQTQLSLRVIRPHDVDESENVVRMSSSSMKLLGIEETDTVDIYNGSKKVCARVLEFDDYSIVINDNRLKIESDLNICIGIPAYLRVDLDINFINCNVIVKRNLKYFFRKNLNNQIMTIIGFIVSLSVINKVQNIKLRIALIFVVMILLIYISFSEIRERISNK